MENNQKLTIWQRLNKTMDDPQDVKQFINPEPEKEILKTKSKEEYEFEKLQMQQTKYIENTWEVVQNKQFEKAMVVNPNRLSGYYDYEAMEQMPEISAALDIFAESICSQSEQGKVLTIFSDDKRIKNELENLFYKKLNLEANLYGWARNLVKYGENFIFLDLEKGKGIVAAEQLPNIEIERFDKSIIRDGQKVDRTKFYWQENNNAEFESWQILHFRLFGDDRMLPYGSSFLAKSRRIFKLLMLVEDSVLINRLTRATDRRVYKVFVGNMEDADIESYVQSIANKFKRTPVVDPKTGQIDTRFNLVGQDQDIFIPIRDNSQANIVENLNGASNLDNIQDVKYFYSKLMTALRVPSAFLTFYNDQGGTTGEGKSLALMDIRFAATVQHLQKAVLSELNKAAMIHLFLAGFEDDIENFTLALTNPSLQSDLLRIEQWKEKIQLYRDVVSDAGNGFSSASMMWAKKNILGFSEKEIEEDLLQQRFEKALGVELAATDQVIKKTGFFDRVDKIYKNNKSEVDPNQVQDQGFGDIPGIGSDFGSLGGGDLGSPSPSEPMEVPPGSTQDIPQPAGGDTTSLKEEYNPIAKKFRKKTTTILDPNKGVISEMIENIDDLLKE